LYHELTDRESLILTCTIYILTPSAKTKGKGMGCLWELGRLVLICCTCGLWLLVGKRKGTGKTKYVNRTVALCQNCGHKWNV
jgi:hypothetical protein